MDIVKVGEFLSQLRRERGLTQEELGALLGVTNKTVSRWETGTYLPPVDMLLSLSELYGLSINELLTGRRLNEEEFRAAAEKNLTEALGDSSFTVGERMQYFRQKWLREHRISLFTEVVAIIGALLVGSLLQSRWILMVIFILSLLNNIVRYNRMMSYVEYRVFGPFENE